MEEYRNLTCVADSLYAPLTFETDESRDSKTASELFTALDACGFAPAYTNVSVTATSQNTYSFQFPVNSR